MLFLAAGAAYDLVAEKAAAWSMAGLTRQTLIAITIGLGVGAILLLTIGFVRVSRRDGSLDIKLDQMEQEYAELLDLKNRS